MTERASSVLLIDDDADFRDLIAFMLRPHGFEVDGHAHFESARAAASGDRHVCVLLDRDLDGTDGLAHLPELSRVLPEAPVVLVTAHDSVDDVVAAMRAGVHDFIGKPVNQGRLVATLMKAAEMHRLRHEVATLQAREPSFEGIVGASPPMLVVYEVIRNVARSDVNVLISGESGTGKELVAQAIHRSSGRSDGPLVCLNMASLPAELIESTLFGHEKGSFTGADKRRIGACEEASGGTLFLDELTEMPIDLQAKLLRFLQERMFRRVGGDRDLTADVRIVSATNRDPLAEVEAGRFRLDLYYRLNVVPIELPPLRERDGDVRLLAEAFLDELSEKHGKSFERITDAALAKLDASRWPGNVRQLRHTIERVVVLHDGPELTDVMVPDDLDGTRSLASTPPSPQELTPSPPTTETATAPNGAANPSFASDDEVMPLAELERRAIEHAIDVSPTVADAAKRLGVSEATIYRRLKQYNRVES